MPDLPTETSIHDDFLDWVTGALDADRSAAFEAHLADCPICGPASSELGPIAMSVAALRPDPVAPVAAPGLETATLVKVDATVAKRETRGRVIAIGALVALAAAACIALVIGALQFPAVVMPTTSTLHAALLPQSSLAPDALGHVSGGEAPTGWTATVITTGLPVTTGGAYYQCWYATGTGAGASHASAGTFTVDAVGPRTMQMWVGTDPAKYPVIEVTLQQKIGATGGSGPDSFGTVVLRGEVGHDTAAAQRLAG